MASSTSWSHLSIDVLQTICEKLIEIKDYIMFGAVSRDCRTVLWLCHKSIPAQSPVLLLPNLTYNASSPTTYTHKFYHSSNFHNTQVLPATRYIGCCKGSHQGWLITTEFPTGTIQLINPSLSVNNGIQLPSLSMLISKAVLSDNPTLTSNYVVMVLVWHNFSDIGNELAFLKPGDTSWSFVHQNQRNGRFRIGFKDIAYYKQKIYGITYLGNLICSDISSTQPKLATVCSDPPIKFKGIWITMRLVESAGDLLCVAREDKCRTTFEIFKFEACECKWIKLKSLRDHSLFLDVNSSLSLMPSNLVNCKANHIYYAYYGLFDKLNAGVFNIEDGSSEPLILENLDAEENKLRPIWVQPTLNLTRSSPYNRAILEQPKTQESISQLCLSLSNLFKCFGCVD